jgi:hypothetical protein
MSTQLSIDLKDHRLYFDGSVESLEISDTFKLFLLGYPPNKIKAKYEDDDIAPLFKKSPSNCTLPIEWVKINNESKSNLIIEE